MDDFVFDRSFGDVERLFSEKEKSVGSKNIVVISKIPIIMESIKSVFPEQDNIGCFSMVNKSVRDLIENKKIDLILIDICYYCHESEVTIPFQRIGNIALLTEPDTIICIEKLLNNNIKGIISKKEKTSDIRKAINQIINEKKMYVSKCVIEDYFNLIPGIRYLTERETTILQLLGRGKKPSRIARELFISVKTVETYRYKIMDKLDISDAESLYNFASFFNQRYLAVDKIFP